MLLRHNEAAACVTIVFRNGPACRFCLGERADAAFAEEWDEC